MNAPPFSLSWGSSVYARVLAINSYGESLESDDGNGGIIITKPDEPVSLAEDISARTQTALQFSWQDGASNGGSTIIDYRVQMAIGDADFALIKTGHIGTSFYIDTLTSGVMYGFKV